MRIPIARLTLIVAMVFVGCVRLMNQRPTIAYQFALAYDVGTSAVAVTAVYGTLRDYARLPFRVGAFAARSAEKRPAMNVPLPRSAIR